MKFNIKILFFISILLVVTSGSIGSGDEQSGIQYYIQDYSEKIMQMYRDAYNEMTRVYNDFIDKNFKPPDYEINITEAVTLKDCYEISLDTKSPCLLINMNIRNNQNESITFELKGKTIVTKDGRQLDKYGGLYNTKQLNTKCDTENFFKLFPNADKKTGICFPPVRKDEDPVMYLGITANGKQKEHNIDLTPYLQ